MDKGNDFSVPFATSGWDSDGATAFTMVPSNVNYGIIKWVGMEYPVRIDYDYSQQTFTVTVNIWD